DEQTRLPFDLAQAPLLRAQLLRLSEDDHILQVVFHHIVFDGGSKAVLFRELGALYAASAPLPALPVQYGDYAEWQRSWLQGDVLEQELEHWRDVLAGMPAALELPTDRPRPPVSSFRGAWRRAPVPPELVDGLLALGRREGATLFMVL